MLITHDSLTLDAAGRKKAAASSAALADGSIRTAAGENVCVRHDLHTLWTGSFARKYGTADSTRRLKWWNTRAPVSLIEYYAACPFKFTGKIDRLTYTLGPYEYTAEK